MPRLMPSTVRTMDRCQAAIIVTVQHLFIGPFYQYIASFSKISEIKNVGAFQESPWIRHTIDPDNKKDSRHSF